MKKETALERTERERWESEAREHAIAEYGNQLGGALSSFAEAGQSGERRDAALLALAEALAVVSESGTHEERVKAYLALLSYISMRIGPVEAEAHRAAMHHAVY